MLLSGYKTANIYVKTVQFIETLCKGDITVRDKKNSKDQFFTVTKKIECLQNFQLHR